MTMPRIIFYDWPYSPFCMKVRAILDHKRLDYEAVNPLPHARELKRRGGTGKAPALDIGGELIVDSTDIAYEVERRWPDPPILPAGNRERGLNHALEDWADESLYFINLYYRWYDREGRKPIPLAFGKSLKGRLAYHYYLRLVLRQIRGQGTLRKSPDHVRRDLDRHLVAIEQLLTPGPYLLGGQPYLCDFAMWGQLNYLNRTPVGAKAIKGRAAIEEYLGRFQSAI